jgi:hypothetical protein
MNRIVNLKKPSSSAPSERSPAPSPVPREIGVRPVAHSPALVPAQPVPQSAPVRHDSASGVIRWHFPSSTSSRTTTATIITCLVLGGVFILFHQYLLGLILGLAAVVFALQGRSQVGHEVALVPHGLVVDGHTYPLKDIKSFWIHYVPGGIQELSVELRRWYLPYLHLPLSGKNPVRIREFFVQFVQEREHSRSILDVTLQKLGL